MATGEVLQAGEVRSGRIESMRAVAALSVLVFHVGVFTRDSGLLGRFVYAGQLGVFLFFALSGYLLFLPFARQLYGNGRRIDIGRYARNRVLRVMPLYYAVLAALAIVGPDRASVRDWVRVGTMTQSFFTATVRNHIDGPMWSLAVEVQFYVLLVVLAFALARLAKTPGTAAVVIGALALLSAAIWVVKVSAPSAPDPRWRYSLPATFFEFTPGMLLALVKLEMERGRIVRLPSSTALVAGAVAAWGLAAYWVDGAAFVVAAASLLLLAAVALPVRDGPITRVLDARALTAVGLASYSLYLWHFPIVEAVARHANLPFGALLAVSLVVCVAVALVSYAVIERPFLKLRERWGSTAAREAPVERLVAPLAPRVGGGG